MPNRLAGRRPPRRAILLAVLALVAATPALASEVAVQACECLLRPGDRAEVSVRYSNTTAAAADLVVEITLPNQKKLYLSPIGLVERQVPWLSVPAGSVDEVAEVIDQTLTTASLPFGNWPLVPPFRYTVSAGLFDSASGAAITPVIASHFEFEPSEPSPPATEPGTLHVFPHQHGDPAWLLREGEAFPAMAEWIDASIALAEQDPSYRFVIDQPLVLQAFEQIRPDRKAALQQLLDAGRAEVAGGFYVLNDLNLLSGESIARQIVYGQRYLEQRWGRRARIAWNLDQFGHPHQMPQLAAKGGMNYYAFTRGLRSLASLGLPGSEFYWRSPDGSRVLANHVGNGYQLGRTLGDVSPDDPELTEIFTRVEPSSLTGNFLTGSGADVSEQVLNGYALNALLPDAIAHWNASQAPGIAARLSTPSEFFAAVEASEAALPTIGPIELQSDGEPDDPRIFPASYASHIEVKQTNERLENLLLDAEKLATIASIEGASYPESEIETQGRNVARNQTHDYLPGTGVDEIYSDADLAPDDFGDRAAQTEAALLALRDDAQGSVASRVDTERPGETVQNSWIVFNTMAWERKDLVRIAIVPAAIAQPARLLDADGHEVTYQISQKWGGGFDLLFVATLPAMGYATFQLVDGTPARPPGEVHTSIPAGLAIPLGAQFRLNVDRNGFVRALRSVATNEPLLLRSQEPADSDDLGGLLWWADDLYGNAYDYGPALTTGSQAGQSSSTYVASGPVLARVVSVGNVADASLAVRELAVVGALGRLDFDTTVYWSDVNKNLHLRFPFAAKPGASIVEGVPYGYSVRGAGHQPVLGWADWGTPALGVSLLNRALFDHQFSLVPGAIPAATLDPQTLDVTLLHSLSRAVFGDFASEGMKQQGVHHYRYALVPHHGSWREAQTPRRAFEFASAPIAVEAPLQSGTLPKRRSYLALNPGSDAVVTVFQREGDAVVIRLYDTTGRATSHTLSFPFLDAATIEKTDLLGGFLDALGAGSEVEVPTAPEEIATLRLDQVRVVAPRPPATGTDFSRSIDLATAEVPRITGADAADLAGRAVSSIGDVDGDGYDDLLVGANQGDGPGNQGASAAGEVAVVFGGPRSRFGDGLGLEHADMTLYGLRGNSFAGTRVAAGDFDCDGFSDIAIGSIGNPTGEESRNASGITWVVFGGPRETLPASMDLASQADLEIWGGPGDIAGQHVAVADLDGNGCDDLVIGAASGDGGDDAVESAGEAYILLGAPRARFVQSGTRVLGIHHDVVLYGAQVFDHFGWAIESGDFDADGYDDLALSAIDADGRGNTKQAAGDVYLFWGGPKATLAGHEFHAQTLENMAVFYGIDTGDLAGFNFGTGDVDADGYDDLLVGVPFSDGKDNVVGDVTGEAALWFGRPRAAIAARSELADVADVLLYGAQPDEATGHTVLISDLNADGKGDLVIGAPVANGLQGQRPEGGAVHILLGRAQDAWPDEIVLDAQAANYRILGAKSYESTGFGLSAGDLDGDGRQDLVIGAPFYSGSGAGTDRIGATYLLFADRFELDPRDVVRFERAEWNPDTGVLQVDATSSSGALATLQVAALGDLAFDASTGLFSAVFPLAAAPPAITVSSLLGGSATVDVATLPGVAPRLVVEAVTNDGDDLADRDPQISGDHVVWTGFDGHDFEIFLWDGINVLPLSDNLSDDANPRLDGDRVVWESSDGNDLEIDYWDGKQTLRLTQNDVDDSAPRIHASEVVWQEGSGAAREILHYRAGAKTRITRNAREDRAPAVENGVVVWQGFDGHDFEIYRWQRGVVTQQTDNAMDDVEPLVSGGVVAWRGFDGNDWEIYQRSGDTTTQLSDDSLDAESLALRDGVATWQQSDGTDSEIVRFADGVLQTLTSNDQSDRAPRTDGGWIVWLGAVAGASDEIFVFDGATGTTTRLTSNAVADERPQVQGGRVVWQAANGSAQNLDVYFWDGSAVRNLSAAGDGVSDQKPSIGGGGRVAWQGFDGDPEIEVSDAGPPRPLTQNRFEEFAPHVDPVTGWVVWHGLDDLRTRVDSPGRGEGGTGGTVVGGDFEIFLWDGTATRRLTTRDQLDDFQPWIHGGKAVWLGGDGHDVEVFFWDGTDTVQLTADEYDQANARTHGGRAVWQGWDGHDMEIFYWDGSTVTQLTDDATNDLAPEIWGDQIVWQAFDGSDFEIAEYDTSIGQRSALSSNAGDDIGPQIADGLVVWQGFDGDDFEIYRWDTAVVTKLTDDSLRDERPRLDPLGRIVWQKSDGFDLEIYYRAAGANHRATDNVHDDSNPEIFDGTIVWQAYDGRDFEVKRLEIP